MKLTLAFIFGSLISAIIYANLPDHDELKKGACFSVIGLGLGKITKVNRETYEYRVKYTERNGWSLPERNEKDSVVFGPEIDCNTYQSIEE